MLYLLTALVAASLGVLLALFIIGAKKRDDDELATGNELDAARMDYLEKSKSQVLYNDELTSWGVLDYHGSFTYSARTLRAAVDGARHRVTT